MLKKLRSKKGDIAAVICLGIVFPIIFYSTYRHAKNGWVEVPKLERNNGDEWYKKESLRP